MQRLGMLAALLAALPAALAAPDGPTVFAAPGNYRTGCFYGDGTEATDWDFRPCGHANTTFNICCLPSANDLCLANGLCTYPGHYMYRGPCDNANGDGCRSICPEVNPNSWVEVQSCTLTEFCCSPGRNAGKPGNCCNDGSKRFPLPDPAKKTTSSSSSAATSAPTSSTTSARTSSSETPVPTNSREEPVPTNSNGSSSSSSTPVGAIAGGVVGGVAGLGAVGMAAWLLLRRRRKRDADKGAELSGDDVKQSPYGPGPPPTEMPGQPVPVESDSRPVQRFEMAG